MSRKKILFIAPTLGLGGAERVVSVLSDYLSKSHNVTVVTLSGNDSAYDTKATYVQFGTKIYNVKIMKFLTLISRIFLIRKLLLKKSPDIIISFMESANIPSIFAVLLLDRASSLVVSVRNNPLEFPWFYRFFIKLLYKIPYRVVAPSKGVAHGLEKLILNKIKIDFIPNPIKLKYIQKMALTPERYSFNIPEIYILAVGSLSHQKGFDRLISIFSKIKIKNLHLIIIGEGGKRKELQRLIHLYELEKRVIMPGTVKNPFYLYRNALCLTLTSRYEGWPNVINEAIACSCPVVSYNCKYGPSEILSQSNGFLIDEGDENGVIDAVNIIYSNKNERERVVNNGLKYVKNYSVNKIAKQWLAIKDIS